ncbi:MAG: c-type cytochrome [Deltaproteobacteria bacterium]|nr:c-type cytochrome [Deltaproteobacteria bacterium]
MALMGVLCAVGVVAGCGEEPRYVAGEELLGGDTTVFDESPAAFSLAARNLIGARRDPFFTGNSMFNRGWVTAPSSTAGQDGLGPTFNATSCSACHFKDGRGRPPETADEEFLGLLVRLSVPGTDSRGGPRGDPNYGGQLNPRAILGVPAEGRAVVNYTDVPGTYADGTPFTLRHPTYEIRDLSFGPLAPNIMLSPRAAPAMIGLGLLEAISDETILALADPDDRDGDGISGRINLVFDPTTGLEKIGRFGWKANQPGLEQQNSGAFLGDIGITSPLFPSENCPAPQVDCISAATGEGPQIDQNKIDQITHYSRFLAVPARRTPKDPVVLRGRDLFVSVGCAACHLTQLRTGTRDGLPELSEQAIRPYTDLLLHDMGDDLADGRPDFLADGREWRTPPLWGIGLTPTVNRHSNFLHDGRARGFAEAILWHGGEGQASREAFRNLQSDERHALIRFLETM